ncbi:MAG TPA: hypothetical protein VH988_02365 [Thermoanaerobaculia bacterium]|jgi:hypothetical protein|nr:hypothetical protein [Thermoanaerobaculia bacterium]
MANSNSEVRRAGLQYLLAVVLVLVVWSISVYMIVSAEFEKVKDVVTVFFGASSLALFIFSIFIAFFAVIGWQSLSEYVRGIAVKEANSTLESKLKEKIDARVGQLEVDRIEPMVKARLKLESEMRGRAMTILGYMIGEASLSPDSKSPGSERDRENLAEAVGLCEQGYEVLRGVGGSLEYMALNNLVFYLSAYGPDSSGRKILIEQARLLSKVAETHQARNLLLTAYRAILEHGTDPVEKLEAAGRLRALLKEGKLTARESREARIYLERFGGVSLPANSALPWENTEGQGI